MHTLGYESAPNETTSSARNQQLKGIFEAALKQTFRGYRVELTAAESGVGLRSRRHICLISNNGGLVLVLGSVDTAAKTGELRTLGAALESSREQLGHELPIPPVEYLAFLQRAKRVLSDFGQMTVTVLTSSAKK